MNYESRIITVRFYRGYWTIFSGENPVVSCADINRAMQLMMECSE